MFFTDTYEPQINGVVTAINLFERELEKLGHEIYVVCPKTPGYKYGENIFTLRSFTFKPYSEYRGALPSLKLLKWVKDIDPDIIHVHTPVTIGLLGISTGKILSKPLIATYHTLMEEYFKIYFIPKRVKLLKKYAEVLSQKFMKKYTKAFYNRADIITVPSSAIKKHIKKCGVTKPILVLPTGIDTDFFNPGKKIEKNLILWVGRLGKEKSLDILLKAFSLIQKALPQVKLVIVGDGPERKNLEELVKKLSLNAEFTGYIPREKLPEYYSRAYLLVSPSTTETQGLTVLEAFACACPVVVANALGFKDFVKDGENGFFAKPRNKKDFAEKILKILKEHRLRKKLSRNARITAEKFSITNQVKKLEKFYKKRLGQKSFY
jgi:glycosyltransferase involved in cell wall biosynthesis